MGGERDDPQWAERVGQLDTVVVVKRLAQHLPKRSQEEGAGSVPPLPIGMRNAPPRRAQRSGGSRLAGTGTA